MGLTEGFALVADLLFTQMLGNEILVVFLALVMGIILMVALRIEVEGIVLLASAFIVILSVEGGFFPNYVFATIVIGTFGVLGWAIYRLIER